jgi:transmembrane sensor
MIREVLTLDHLKRLGADGAAALLLVRQDAAGDDPDEAMFDEWLAADPAHADAWARACDAWTAFDGAGAADLEVFRQSEEPEEPQARARWGFAIAASVAVIAATGGTMLLDRQGGPEPGSAAGIQVAAVDAAKRMLTTARGEHRSLRLADASTVTLNTDSAVAVAFKPGGERRLELVRGQAFFKVAQDKTRPFLVSANGQTVTALGTQFEVRADASTLRVVLVEGRVSVAPARGAPVVMRPGQQLLAGPQGVTVSVADVAAVGDWQRGVVTFKGTTLAAAVTELNRYSTSQLKVDDPGIARLTVSGVFQTNDARRFARTIAEIYPVRVVPAGDRHAAARAAGGDAG